MKTAMNRMVLSGLLALGVTGGALAPVMAGHAAAGGPRIPVCDEPCGGMMSATHLGTAADGGIAGGVLRDGAKPGIASGTNRDGAKPGLLSGSNRDGSKPGGTTDGRDGAKPAAVAPSAASAIAPYASPDSDSIRGGTTGDFRDGGVAPQASPDTDSIRGGSTGDF